MDIHEMTRRAFLAAATASAAVVVTGCNTVNTARVVPRRVSPNERLNVAAIGAGGQGATDIGGCSSENVVALCDPDWRRAEASFERFRTARQFKDYRVMLERMPEIEACTISTPDHTHAPAAYMAMMMGKHVYVQKPLTHTIAEARLLTRTARETGVATQMGNQGHCGDGVRDLCEMLWSGAIGDVREAHTWTDRPIWPQGLPEPLPAARKPATMDWDLWIGSGPMRPYNGGYAPFNWRGWWDYGCGALGDMACHIMDPAWWALRLGEADSYTAEVVMQEGMTRESPPLRSTIKYEFPARAGMPPCVVYWYDGFWGEGNDKRFNRPPLSAELQNDPRTSNASNGSIFYGSDGIMTSTTYGREPHLIPEERMASYTPPPPSIPRVPGGDPYLDWIRACKDGQPASSNFDYSGPFTEMVLLGNVALLRGQKVHYNARRGEITNDRAANALLSKEYRPGWELPV